MQKHPNRRILSVLGFLLVSVIITGCSWSSNPRELSITSESLPRPQLEIPQADQLRMRNIEWHVITPDNVDQVFEDIEENGRSVVFFALSDEGYENLSLNISDLRSFVQQQQRIILAYENFYKEQE